MSENNKQNDATPSRFIRAEIPVDPNFTVTLTDNRDGSEYTLPKGQRVFIQPDQPLHAQNAIARAQGWVEGKPQILIVPYLDAKGVTFAARYEYADENGKPTGLYHKALPREMSPVEVFVKTATGRILDWKEQGKDKGFVSTMIDAVLPFDAKREGLNWSEVQPTVQSIFDRLYSV